LDRLSAQLWRVQRPPQPPVFRPSQLIGSCGLRPRVQNERSLNAGSETGQKIGPTFLLMIGIRAPYQAGLSRADAEVQNPVEARVFCGTRKARYSKACRRASLLPLSRNLDGCSHFTGGGPGFHTSSQPHGSEHRAVFARPATVRGPVVVSVGVQNKPAADRNKMNSCLAEKDPLRPGEWDLLKRLQNGLLTSSNRQNGQCGELGYRSRTCELLSYYLDILPT